MIQILLGSFRPELQQEVTSIVSVLTPRLYFRNAHEKYRKTITRDFNSLAPFLLRVMSTHPKRSTDHGGGRRGCGCRRGGSPHRRRNSKRRLVQSWRGIHGLPDASIGGGGVERYESGHCAILFFLCSQASSPGRDVRRARSKPRMGEKPSITCQKLAIEFGLSVLLAFIHD